VPGPAEQCRHGLADGTEANLDHVELWVTGHRCLLTESVCRSRTEARHRAEMTGQPAPATPTWFSFMPRMSISQDVFDIASSDRYVRKSLA
jgi:hypothetical protein